MESTTFNDARQAHQQVSIGHEPNHSPVSRCTLDVLMCIFETILLTSDNKLAISIIISHVCRRWRQVALDMPKLWNEIDFLCTDPIDKVQSYLDQMIPRVKATPADLWIKGVDLDSLDVDDKVPLDLHIFRLDRMPVISDNTRLVGAGNPWRTI